MFKLGFELKVYNHNKVPAIVSWLMLSYSTFALLVALPLPARMGVYALIPQLAPYQSALPLAVKPKCSPLVGPASLVS